MTALSLCAIVLASFGGVPGESAGWGTGEVVFRAYLTTSEHQEIYPICAGRYTAEAAIEAVLDDPGDVLRYVTTVDICYDDRLNLTWGQSVEVRGIYYDGACPFAFCGRVEASSIVKVAPWVEPEPNEPPEGIVLPTITTVSAQATETTVTFMAIHIGTCPHDRRLCERHRQRALRLLGLQR
jgi:hypothetical protein